MSQNLVDARGLSCPEPVLLAQEALSTYRDSAFTVAVSSPTARDNVKNLLQDKGRETKVTEAADGWRIEAAAK